jgi:hypothetical protein
MILDGHVTIGANREVALELDELLTTMDELGIDRALVSPPEWFVPVRNREGNELTAAAAARSGGRLMPYAVATPWLGREAVEQLERARELGARALKLDPGLQGFSLVDGLAEPLATANSRAAGPSTCGRAHRPTGCRCRWRSSRCASRTAPSCSAGVAQPTSAAMDLLRSSEHPTCTPTRRTSSGRSPMLPPRRMTAV